MKNILFTLLLIASQIALFAQKDSKKEIKPDITSIVVYTEGVEVSHVLDVQLSEGRNLLVFQHLSSKISERSIRFNADVDISVLSVTHKIDHLTLQNEKPRIKQVKDSLKQINASILLFQNELNALEIQKELLLKNQNIGGTENGTSVLELQKAADFFQTRIFEINKRVSKITMDLNEFGIISLKLNSELTELNADYNFKRSEIIVLVDVEKPAKKKVELRYYIKEAGWAPVYEIKADDIDKPLHMNYRARVFNNTDIDWTNVQMMLSTADPHKSVNYPVLLPWRLNFVGSHGSIADMNPYQTSNLNENYFFQQQQQQKSAQMRGRVNFVPISVSEIGIELPLNTKYSIPSDSKPYIVDVAEYKLQATYRHICVPKMNKGVYLLAEIVDWEDLNLVEGEANVYFAETYVGKSYIYTREVSDTLNLSLGIDKKVVVTRNKIKNYTSRQFLGSKVKETIQYQFEVKNNRKVPINIEIIDQVPVSENSDIEVFVDEIAKADYSVLTGLLNWRLNLTPDQKETFNMQYSVRYPRNKHVETSGKKHRAVYAPSF